MSLYIREDGLAGRPRLRKVMIYLNLPPLRDAIQRGLKIGHVSVGKAARKTAGVVKIVN